MRDPSSRLLKFRLQLEEYNYTVEYIKGQSNSAADALSRIIITSDDLKSMNEQVLNVMTRGQYRRMRECEEGERSSIPPVDSIDMNSRPDQPRIVEVLKKPGNIAELSLMTQRSLEKIMNNSLLTNSYKCFVYVPAKSIVYINTTSRSPVTRDGLVRDLSLFCNRVDIRELCIIRNDNNKEFIAGLIKEINKYDKWSGPRLYVANKVQKIENLDDRRVILNDFHLLPTSGHAGIRRMTNNIKKYYFWPSMGKDITEYVSKCDQCQKQKYSIHTKQPMVVTTTANSAFEKIFLDVVGHLQKDDSGYSYILTLQCELSKFVEAYPIFNKETVSVARALVDNFVLRFGIPQEIATDRGAEFISSTMKEVCQLLKINQLTSTAYHHESIGALENSHKTMGAYLRINCQNKTSNWSSWLPYWCFAYNNTVHSETKYTPHELVFGKRCLLPSNFIHGKIDPLYAHESYPLEFKYRLQVAQKDAHDNLIKSKTTRKEKYDCNMNPVSYKEGDYLFIRNTTGHKMDPIYLGPYEVVKDLDCNVKILKNGKLEIIHKNRTKLYKN